MRKVQLVTNNSARELLERDGIKGSLDKEDLSGTCAVSGYTDREAPPAFDNRNPARTLTAARLFNSGPPFLAGTKLPSMKDSDQSSRPLLSIDCMSAFQAR